jgi:hypothetical protein
MTETKSYSIQHESNQPHVMKDRLTKLRVVCATAEVWGQTTCKPRVIISICRKKSRDFETVLLQWLIEGGRHTEHWVSRTPRLYCVSDYKLSCFLEMPVFEICILSPPYGKGFSWLARYKDKAAAASLQILSNSLFTNHSTIRRCALKIWAVSLVLIWA